MNANEFLKKLKASANRLQWRMVLTISASFMFICLIILGIRIRNAIQTHSRISGSTVVAAMARQISIDPWFQELDVNELITRPDEDAPAEMVMTEVPPIQVPLDFGSIFRDMQIDARGLLARNIHLFYITKDGNTFPLFFGPAQRPALPLNEDSQIHTSLDEIIAEGKELAERTDFEQVIMTDADHSMALALPHDEEGNSDGYFYIYMKDPELIDLLRPMLRASLHEMFGTIIIIFLMSLLSGFVFANSWANWFRRVSEVLDNWSRGHFSEKIEVEKTPAITEWRELAEQLNEMSGELEQIVETRQELAASEERNALARELHDSIKQQLFSINMNLGAAQMLQEKNPALMKEKLELTSRMSRETLLELDSLISAMRPPSGSDQKLLKDLLKLIENWQKSCDIRLSADIVQVAQIHDEAIGKAVYRIIQEGLSNILRHSHAGHAELKIIVSPTAIRILIRDDGIGFDRETVNEGVGLHSMQERAEELNGTFTLESSPEGTRINVYIPQRVNI